MYSRNFGTFEDLTGMMGNSQKAIPVKVFGDNTAYERFSKLGEAEKPKLREEISIETQASTDAVIDEEKEVIIENEGVAEVSDDKGKFSHDLSKLFSFIDRDTLIIILASLMILLGDETNDKLTPLCLLAIMIL